MFDHPLEKTGKEDEKEFTEKEIKMANLTSNQVIIKLKVLQYHMLLGVGGRRCTLRESMLV